MNHAMSITAILDEPVMLKTVVEKLASRHVDMGYSKATIPQQWDPIDSSCIQADVSGTLGMHIKSIRAKEAVNIPFTGCFLFTCIKGKNGFFNLEWSSSLS
ncbi:MAG: hypothetical protein ABI741_06370 [Ferruginibacter sp.]